MLSVAPVTFLENQWTNFQKCLLFNGFVSLEFIGIYWTLPNPKKRCVSEKLKALPFDHGNVTSFLRYIKHELLYLIPRGWYHLCLSISFVPLEGCRSDGKGTSTCLPLSGMYFRADLKLLYISQYKRTHHALLTQPFETSVCSIWLN